MKLRLTPNSIRLRLTRPEVADMPLTKRLECVTQVGPAISETLVYRLEFVDGQSGISVSFQQSQISILIPTDAGVQWAKTNEVGLYGETPWGLRLIVEKDFKCLDAARRAEDDADAFEHPAAQAKHDTGSKNVLRDYH